MQFHFLLAAAILALMAGCEAEQPAQPSSASAAPAQTTAKADPARGKQLAEPCAACHGQEGTDTARGVPYIGGQLADYLLASMRAYREGGRRHEEMRLALARFNESDLADIAAYYAGLPVTWKGKGIGVPPEIRTLSRPDPRAIAAGRAKALACQGCHGEDGVSRRPEYPSLAGLPMNYFRDATYAYFKGGRTDRYMAMFKAAVTDGDIRNLAAYYSSTTPQRVAEPLTGNVAAGRAKSGACAGCHGADGNSISPNFPSLTGQSAQYLAKATLDYRDGKRRHAMMKSAVARLSNKDIQDLAAFYASQTPVKIGVRMSRANGDPLSEGARIAASCNGCHGTSGNSVTPGTPSLTGMGAPYLIKAITDYRDGRRKHAIMQGMVSTLSDLDIEKVSYHYATQQPKVSARKVTGELARGKKIGDVCDGCHGKEGRSADPRTPSLAGQDPTYMAAALRNYASKSWDVGTMQSPAAALSKQDILDVTAYYSQLAPERPKFRVPETVQAVAARCGRCHGDRGQGGPQAQPRLAGQAEGYLVRVIQAYQEGARKHPAMHAMSDVLSLIEIRAVARHYAGQ